MKTQKRNGGLIKLIIIIIVAVILLNYFQVDLVAWAEKLRLREAWQKMLELWHYLTNR